MRKIMFHSVNGVGLGHLNRTTTIAKEIDADIFFITNALNTKLLEKFKYKQLPNLSIDNPELQEEIKSEIDKFKPDTIVFDTFFPYDVVSKSKHDNVLILRLIDNAGFINLFSDPILNKFSKIIIPHEKDEIKFSSLGDSVKHFLFDSDKVFFSGPILRNDFLNLKLKPKNENITVILGGGGKDKDNHSIEDIYDLVVRTIKKNLTIIVGPNSKFKKEPGVKTIKFTNNFHKILAKSSIVISHAGYNQINELLYLGIPSIIFPIIRYKENQYDRANWFLKKGQGIVLNHFNENSMFSAIKRLNNITSKPYLFTPGNKIAADLIKNISEKNRISLGDTCNNNCKKCIKYFKKTKKRHKEDILSDIKNFSGREEIVFYGGDPLINDDILSFISASKKNGYKKIVIETNGRMLSYFELCEKLKKAGVDEFRIYIFSNNSRIHDNMTQVEDSYEQTMKGIKNLESLEINYKLDRLKDFGQI